MSRYIDADALKPDYYDEYVVGDDEYVVRYYSETQIDNALSIDLADYVPKDFHDKTCEAMAKRHQADRPQEWIPCSERLPKKDGRYMVTRQDYVTQTDFTDILWHEKGLWWNRQSIGDYAVIAWMPLPEPWKGADDE